MTPRRHTAPTLPLADARFTALCRDLRDLAGGPGPDEPERDAVGAAMCLTLGDAQVQLLQRLDRPDCVFSRVVVDPVARGHDEPVWREVLEANFGLCLSGGPVFSRDPHSGALLLQQRWPVSTTPQAMYEALTGQAALADPWCRAHDCRPSRREPPAPAARPRGPGLRALAEPLSRRAAIDLVQVHELTPGTVSLVLRLHGIDVQICELAHDPEHLHLVGDLARGHEADPHLALDLATANAWLLCSPHPCTLCRMPLTGDCVLVDSVPRDDLGAERLLRQGLGLAARIRTLRAQVQGFRAPQED